MYLLFVGSTTFRFRFHFCVRPFGGSDGSSGGGGSGDDHLDQGGGGASPGIRDILMRMCTYK